MQHYLDVTDPELCLIEMDIYWAHVAQHQHRWRYDWEGNRVEDIFDPLATVASRPSATRCTTPRTATAPASQLGVGDGYTMIPFGDPRSDIDFADLLQGAGREGLPQPQLRAGQRPGLATPTPEGRGQSLRFTKISAANMNALRG